MESNDVLRALSKLYADMIELFTLLPIDIGECIIGESFMSYEAPGDRSKFALFKSKTELMHLELIDRRFCFLFES